MGKKTSNYGGEGSYKEDEAMRVHRINSPMKIKYIASPVIVKPRNAGEFKEIVQKLTGKHSTDNAICTIPKRVEVRVLSHGSSSTSTTTSTITTTTTTTTTTSSSPSDIALHDTMTWLFEQPSQSTLESVIGL